MTYLCVKYILLSFQVRGDCLCGARRIDAQLGLERTPEEYVANLVAVFREVRRVLRNDGVLWLNLGDSYATAGGAGYQGKNGQRADRRFTQESLRHRDSTPGLKPKDLLGIPWLTAFALRADGWYLRSEVIWAKPNPMPESVIDRPTKAHEQVFLLSKSERYHYDAAAVAESASGTDERPQTVRAREIAAASGLTVEHIEAIRSAGATDAGKAKTTQSGTGKNTAIVQRLADEAKAALGGYYREFLLAPTRNARSVWTIATQPYPAAHFATFPVELARRCILAGSRPGDTVLDPFGGSGTTAAVAVGHGRQAIYIDLNPAYLDLARGRIGPMLCRVPA